MPDNDYPRHIDRLAAGALSQMADYLGSDIERPDDMAMLEDRAVGGAAKLLYFNTIMAQLRLIETGSSPPRESLAHLDAAARAWMSKERQVGAGQPGATLARALAGRWRNWELNSPERRGFVNHFRLPE